MSSQVELVTHNMMMQCFIHVLTKHLHQILQTPFFCTCICIRWSTCWEETTVNGSQSYDDTSKRTIQHTFDNAEFGNSCPSLLHQNVSPITMLTLYQRPLWLVSSESISITAKHHSLWKSKHSVRLWCKEKITSHNRTHSFCVWASGGVLAGFDVKVITTNYRAAGPTE